MDALQEFNVTQDIIATEMFVIMMIAMIQGVDAHETFGVTMDITAQEMFAMQTDALKTLIVVKDFIAGMIFVIHMINHYPTDAHKIFIVIMDYIALETLV